MDGVKLKIIDRARQRFRTNRHGAPDSMSETCTLAKIATEVGRHLEHRALRSEPQHTQRGFAES